MGEKIALRLAPHLAWTVALFLFGVYVWPTAYLYETLKTENRLSAGGTQSTRQTIVRVHRATGARAIVFLQDGRTAPAQYEFESLSPGE